MYAFSVFVGDCKLMIIYNLARTMCIDILNTHLKMVENIWIHTYGTNYPQVKRCMHVIPVPFTWCGCCYCYTCMYICNVTCMHIRVHPLYRLAAMYLLYIFICVYLYLFAFQWVQTLHSMSVSHYDSIWKNLTQFLNFTTLHSRFILNLCSAIISNLNYDYNWSYKARY